MVKFLINRPIAVTMAFIGVLVLGITAASFLPVSLVPDVDIPRITVKIEAPGYSARELEKGTLNNLRMYLMQVNNITEIQSEARDGSGVINMEFNFGTSIDLAYIAVNEQIDKASSSLPKDIPRPVVVKASASDIPVFYLNISLKGNDATTANNSIKNEIDDSFIDLSNFADEIIRRRIEQLPQVAMADMSGRVFTEIVIIPYIDKLNALALPLEKIEQAILKNNITLGNLIIRDKQYQYNVRFGNRLLNEEDIGNIYLNHNNRIWQIKDFCQIITQPQNPVGLTFSNGNAAISIAIIKQADAKMQSLKTELHKLVEYFKQDYPQIEFTITQDQTKLLDYTMSNLSQSLYIGAFLAFLVMFLFLKDYRSPWLIIISIPSALIVSLLGFYLMGISINIISLSGLILCIGLMIDNSIIVIDNISQHRERGNTLDLSCINGANEVFRPLLSSVLTTCSVFIPLIFLGGLTGALFFDQAMAITIGLVVSLVVAMVLLPVYYKLFYKKSTTTKANMLNKINTVNYQKLYSKGFAFVMRNQLFAWIIFIFLLFGTVVLYNISPKERLPGIERNEIVLFIDWNENIHLNENNKRIFSLLEQTKQRIEHSTVYSGRQQFMLGSSKTSNEQQAYIYLKCHSENELNRLINDINSFFGLNYPFATINFNDAENLFDMIFAEQQPPLVVRLRPLNDYGYNSSEYLQKTIVKLQHEFPEINFSEIAVNNYIELLLNTELLALHQADASVVKKVISRAFRQNQLFTIRNSQNIMPVIIGSDNKTTSSILNNYTVTNNSGIEIPLHLLLSQSNASDLKSIIAGTEGEYYPVEMNIAAKNLDYVTKKVQSCLREDNFYEAGFSGNIFSQRELVKELVIIGTVALLLLFFILAAQFESLRMPFIVLLEVPIALFGALIMLQIFGESINIMSMIGIIVMAGITINDSILKIDTINRLISSGMPLLRALITAGHYRLKPILMTSITTILALLPFLFIKGFGGDLQKPLALAVIGGLGLGTFVSLYFIPICYYLFYKKRK
ncbi:MAG: efflux RND transporter permease subunit [Bacteroidetes bacterium]|nr:efflux RND transporter permease subunit [Bacteroidota bacterium]